MVAVVTACIDMDIEVTVVVPSAYSTLLPVDAIRLKIVDRHRAVEPHTGAVQSALKALKVCVGISLHERA